MSIKFTWIISLISFISLLPLLFLYIKEKKINNKNDFLVNNCSLVHETKSGGVYLSITINDFNKLEFEDSVDIIFSNGYELLDLLYYNGYYVDINEPLLFGYPKYGYIKVSLKYGEDFWIIANLTLNDTTTILLNERAKYIRIQNAMNIYYGDEQGNTPDIVFANFSNVKVGNIKENILYRSASPSDNVHKRAPVVDKLIKEAGIKYIIDLSNLDEELKNLVNKDDFESPYFLSLYNNSKVIALGMNINSKNKILKKNELKDLVL